MSDLKSAAPAIKLDWVAGDALGLQIPAHSEALQPVALSFLTDAFRANGVLGQDNRVSRVTQFEDCPGGSTGRKLLLSVAYEKPGSGLCTDLFVKFSRDYTDPIRDRARIQMESEVRFALLSRIPEFPIAVPKVLFADYHSESGTGILITERIAFGTNGIERHYEKCLDYEMPEPLEHYQALIKALARLAGSHKAGRLPESVAHQFPFDPSKLTVSKRAPLTPEQVSKKVTGYAAFAARVPQLLPANIRSPEFIAEMATLAPRFPAQEGAVRELLQSTPKFIALCHWNAHVDNAWFWRNAQGELACGLMDWGHASQMNVAMAIGGCLTGADAELMTRHVDDLIALFATEFHKCGAPELDVRELKRQFLLNTVISGLLLLDAPILIQRQVPDLDQVPNIFDPRIKNSELARAQLHFLTMFLNLWQSQSFGKVFEEFARSV